MVVLLKQNTRSIGEIQNEDVEIHVFIMFHFDAEPYKKNDGHEIQNSFGETNIGQSYKLVNKA
jgi:hypothetical protein